MNLLAIPGSDKECKKCICIIFYNGLVIYLIIQTNLHKIYNLKLYKIKKENKENYDYVTL